MPPLPRKQDPKPILPVVHLAYVAVAIPRPRAFAQNGVGAGATYERSAHDVVARANDGAELMRWPWWAHNKPTRHCNRMRITINGTSFQAEWIV